MSKNKYANQGFDSIDVFIIALAVVCILGVLLRSFVFDKEDKYSDMTEFIITFKSEGVQDEALSYLVEGDLFRIKASKKPIGRLDGEIIHTVKGDEYNDNGEGVSQSPLGEYPAQTRLNIVGRIFARGKMTDRGLYLESGVYLLPNVQLITVSEHIEIAIRILSIEPI